MCCDWLILKQPTFIPTLSSPLSRYHLKSCGYN